MPLSSTTGDVAAAVSAWSGMNDSERAAVFRSFNRADRERLFLDLRASEQSQLLLSMPPHERFTYFRVLAPDDAADVIQESPIEERPGLLDLLDEKAHAEVSALLAFGEDSAGGLMNARFARLRPEMTVDEAITYLRLQGRSMETIYYAYVLDSSQRLLGVVSVRELFTASGRSRVSEVMTREVVSVHPDTDQESVARTFASHGLMAVPVVD
ncbi:MAG: CBS domain-containing protein, partial [Bryobacterales bacterium]|nr:CBS domain-containing protein [Bryobacterales bacterium]